MKRGKQKGGQLLAQPVDEQLRHLVRSRAQLEHRNALGEGIDSHPEPEHLGVTAHARAQFVQLQMGEHKVAEGALMQGLGMGPCPYEPMCDGHMSKAKAPFSRRQIQSFRQRTQHRRHLLRWRFPPIQRCVQARTGDRLTRLAAPSLDPLSFSIAAVAHDGMDLGIADAVVPTGSVRASKALGLHAFGRSSPAFDLPPGLHRSRRWFSRR